MESEAIFKLTGERLAGLNSINNKAAFESQNLQSAESPENREVLY